MDTFKHNLLHPEYDVWGGLNYAGSWSVAPNIDFKSLSEQECNAWFAQALAATLQAFSPLVRMWRVEFNNIDRDDVERVSLIWSFNQTNDEFVNEVMAAIGTYEAAIYSMEIKVDVFAHTRTIEQPEEITQGWLREASEFGIWGGPHNKAYLNFNVDHTLFSAWSASFADNDLYPLNNPLLETALRNWERDFGPITDVQGQPNIYPYGFLPEIPQQNASQVE